MLPRDIAMTLGFTRPPTVDRDLRQVSLVELYVTMVSKWAESERIEANDQPLRFLIPLLELNVNRFQALASYYNGVFLSQRADPEADVFASVWRPLRGVMVNAKVPFEAFKQYDSCYAERALQNSIKLQYILRRFNCVNETVLQLEQHVRDDLQLQVGHLSLQESKESIKQSKIALEESKRVKMRM